MMVSYPVMLIAKIVAPSAITNTDRIGRAMPNIVRKGFPTRILGNAGINTGAAASQ